MSSITFVNPQEQNGKFLYGVQTSTKSLAVYLYYLTWNNSQSDPPANSLTLADTLERNGCYIFSSLADLNVTPDDLWTHLGLQKNNIALAWIRDSSLEGGSFIVLPANQPKPSRSGSVTANFSFFSFSFYSIALLGSGNYQLKIDATTLTAGIYSTKFSKEINLTQGGKNLAIATTQEPLISISFDIFSGSLDENAYPELAKPSAGALHFTGTQWPISSLYFMFNATDNRIGGGALRYYYPDGNEDQKITYPFYAPAPAGSTATADFTVQLDYFYPTIPQRCYFMVTDGSNATSVFGPSTAGGFTRFGKKIAIAPVKDYGYYLNTTKTKGAFYLAPIGQFKFQFSDADDELNLMLGLSTLEYAQLKNGSQLRLIPNQNAYAASFAEDKTAKLLATNGYSLSPATLEIETAADITELLQPKFRTSYVQIIPPATGQWDYYSQPLNSTYYAQTASGSDVPLADVVQIKVGSISANPPSFPMGFYWNIANAKNNPNSGVAATTISAFEQKILTTTRFNQFLPLAAEGDGPAYILPGQQLARVFSTNGFIGELNGSLIANGPAAGTASKLLFAKSDADYLSVNANANGVVNPQLNTALMNDQGFIVLNDWESQPTKFPMAHQLTVEGFTFNVEQITSNGQTITPIVIFKFGRAHSLLELIDSPSNWSNPDYFLADGKVQPVTAQLQQAIQQANNTQHSTNDPFQYFRKVILTDPTWTGMLVFNCPINGSNMPADFQMLMAGLDGPLVAHHFGVELNQLAKVDQSGGIDIEKSSLLGVIHYQEAQPQNALTLSPILRDPQELPAGSYALAMGQQAATDYKFIVLELIVLFKNSAIQNFDCKVGLMINKLFSRAVHLRGSDGPVPTFANEALVGDVNTFTIKGRYQKTGKVGTIIFTSDTHHIYQFNPNQHYVRVLDDFVITSAALNPTGSEPTESGETLISARFSVNGDLVFAHPIIPGQTALPDLFGYGQTVNKVQSGLPTRGIAFNISVTLDEHGQPIQASRKVSIDTTNLTVQENKLAVRKASLINAFPFKLSGFIQGVTADDSIYPAIDTKTLGKAVGIVQLADNPVSSPAYALRFELPMGSLGALAEAHASIDAHLLLAWGPTDATPDNDGAAVFIQLPEASVGVSGFNLEGIVKTVFGDANLMRVATNAGQSVYVLLFNNVGISILGVKLPPKVITDFVVFGDPTDGANGNIGWSVAATQATAAPGVLASPVNEQVD